MWRNLRSYQITDVKTSFKLIFLNIFIWIKGDDDMGGLRL